MSPGNNAPDDVGVYVDVHCSVWYGTGVAP